MLALASSSLRLLLRRKEAPDKAHGTRPSRPSFQPTKGSETPDGKGAGSRGVGSYQQP